MKKTKICSKCGIKKKSSEYYYHKQRKYYMESCKMCNKKYKEEYNSKLKRTNLLEYQLRNRASELVRRSKIKGLPYEKKMFHTLKEIFNKQKGLCYYTGIEMELDGFGMDNPNCFVIDRVKPELGYVRENIVFCCNAINKIKSSYTIEKMKWWVSQIK